METNFYEKGKQDYPKYNPPGAGNSPFDKILDFINGGTSILILEGKKEYDKGWALAKQEKGSQLNTTTMGFDSNWFNNYGKTVLIIVVLGISLSGIYSVFFSSNELSRSKAEKLIKEKFQLPKDEIKALTIVDGTVGSQMTSQRFKKLEAEGLLTWGEYGSGWNSAVRADLTEKGKQYTASEERGTNNSYVREMDVKVAKLEFGEITGIIERKEFNIAEVKYTVIRKDITPFGKVAFNLNEGVIEENVEFTKYDDGWRIGK